MDMLQPDLFRCASTALEFAPGVHQLGIEIITHSWLTDFLHVLAALPEATWVEFNVLQSRLRRGVVTARMPLGAGGIVAVPTGPGLVPVADPELIASHEIRIER